MNGNRYYNETLDRNARNILRHLGLKAEEQTIELAAICIENTDPFVVPVPSGLHLFFRDRLDIEQRFTLTDKYDIKSFMCDLHAENLADLFGKKVMAYSHKDRIVALTPV